MVSIPNGEIKADLKLLIGGEVVIFVVIVSVEELLQKIKFI